MGQGTESCGGYEIEFDPYDEVESDGFRVWHGRCGSIEVCKMEDGHIENAIRTCKKLADRETFDFDREKWLGWIDNFEDELSHRAETDGRIPRKKQQSRATKRKNRTPPKKLIIQSGTHQKMKCYCGRVYTAKTADLKRGWGLSCCKRCAAIRRKYGSPAAVSYQD